MPRNLRTKPKENGVKLQQLNAAFKPKIGRFKEYRPIKAAYMDASLKLNQSFYDSLEWQSLSEQTRQNNPFCIVCGSHGCRLFVDHIKPVKYFPELALDLANLQVLCAKCHAIKTANDKKLYANQTPKDVDLSTKKATITC